MNALAAELHFALTKIQPPRSRADLVARSALEERLGAALASQRLTLISAPAGFGKTAALTRQLAALSKQTAVAWVAADADDDLGRFTTCLLAALDPHDLPWRTSPDALVGLLSSSETQRRVVASEIVNALMATELERGLIVIDDAHRIEDPAVFQFLDMLIERLPAHWGVVIATRVDPPLALARWRARGELSEFRQDGLRFTGAEIERLLDASGRARTDDVVAALLGRTHGWAAGLRLALNSLGQTNPLRPSGAAIDRHMFDYLASEVLDEMPAELRGFLLRCSVLPELTAARCAMVSGDANAARLLEQIERRGLFVSALDNAERTLVLHDLFRDCLDDRLRREHPEDVPHLLRRAAEGEADPVRRISFLTRAGAWDEAERVFGDAGPALLTAGAIDQVLRLIEQFPAEQRARSSVLARVRGLAAWAVWDWPAMLDSMHRAVVNAQRDGDEAGLRSATVYEAIAMGGLGRNNESAALLATVPAALLDDPSRALARLLHAWNAQDAGHFADVGERYGRVIDVIENSDSLQLWYQCIPRPLYIRLPGMGVPLARFVEGVMRRVDETPSPLRAIANVVAAWLALWRGAIDVAMTHVGQAEADAGWLGWPPNLRMFVHTVRAAALALRGDRDGAYRSVHRLLDYFDTEALRGNERPSMLAHYMFYAVRIADTLGDSAALRAYAARMPDSTLITNRPLLERPLLTLPARLAASEGQHAQACEIWARALDDEAAIDVNGLAAEARVRYAYSLLASGRTADAAAALQPLFDGVQRSGEVGGALFAGAKVLAALAGAEWRGALDARALAMLRDWCRRLDGHTATAPGVLPAIAATTPAAVATVLSARERAVLERIAAGDSNKLIARAFDLSPHTVKRHVANILDKLGAQTRGQAAARWREGPHRGA